MLECGGEDKQRGVVALGALRVCGAPRARARGAQRLSPLGNIMFATTLAVAMTPDSDVTDDALFALMIKRRWDQAFPSSRSVYLEIFVSGSFPNKKQQ